jgi:hypothetical protein
MNYAVFTGTEMMVAPVYTSKLRQKEHINPEQGDEGYLLRVDEALIYNKETEVFHPKNVNPRTSPVVADWNLKNQTRNEYP